MNYYNENDPKAAAWLRELIAHNLIAPGIVDQRSITEIKPYELTEYTQCHFFAGIGGWSAALRLALWPDDCPVWTGSCPCQPFSVAGKGLGTADERHLWPIFGELIRQCKPATVFGEQVASKSGRVWLAGIRTDLEALGYAVGGSDLCAACVGAPHIRQRLYWVANDPSTRLERSAGSGIQGRIERLTRSSEFSGLANTECSNEQFGPQAERQTELAGRSTVSRMEFPEGDGREQRGTEPSGGCSESRCGVSGVGDTMRQPSELDAGGFSAAQTGVREEDGKEHGDMPVGPQHAGSGMGAWANFDLIPCRDGKSRRIESGTFPLAHGVPHRVGLLRGYGNAIVPQLAAEFIKASREAIEEIS